MTDDYDHKIVPALTLIGPWEGDNTWTVTTSDYDCDDPHDICSQVRFNTKEEAEAFIAECKKRGPVPKPSRTDDNELPPYDDPDDQRRKGSSHG